MTNQSTIDKLIEMRLSSMADAFRIQMNDSTMKEVKADPSGRTGAARCQHRSHRLSIRSEAEQSLDQPSGNL